MARSHHKKLYLIKTKTLKKVFINKENIGKLERNEDSIRDDTHMESMKIVQFSRAQSSMSIYLQNSSTPLPLDVQFQTNPRSPNDNQSIKRKHNPRMTITSDLSTWENCSPWDFDHSSIQNTIILGNAVENCYLPHNFGLVSWI